MRGRVRFGLAAILIVILCGGCATVRRARKAQDPANTPPGERTVTAGEAGLSSNTVLTLDQAVQVGLAYHPSVVQARWELATASQQVHQAVAAYWPSLQASARYQRATSKTKGASRGSGAANSYSAGLSADLTLLDFGRTPAAVRQARARLDSVEAQWRAARNDVTFAVRTAFFDLCKAQGLLQVAEETERQFQVHLEQAQVMFEVGRRIKYDVTKAQVDLGNARLSLVDARNAVLTTRAVLTRSLGMAEPVVCPTADAPIDSEFSMSIEDGMRAARAWHPQLQALQAQERAASGAVDAAIADLYPSLALNGGYTGSGSGLPLVWNWSAGAGALATLFDGGRRTSAIESAVADLHAARATVADQEQQIYLVLGRAVAQLDSARQRLALTDLIVRQAQESLTLVNERYKVGQASSVEQADAAVTLATAEADRVKARFDYQTAVALIRHTTGEDKP